MSTALVIRMSIQNLSGLAKEVRGAETLLSPDCLAWTFVDAHML